MRNLMSLLLAFVLGVGVVGTSGTAAAAAPERPAVPLSAPSTPTTAQQSVPTSKSARDSVGYATREKQAGDRKDFRGGGVAIYLGGSAVAVALIILLILIVL